MEYTKKNIALTFVVTLVMAMTLMAMLAHAMNVPDVHTSSRTQQCVAVFDADGNKSSVYDCINRPTKYDTVWVK